MKVAHSTTSSTDALPRRIPGASGHEPSFAGLPAPHIPIPHDLPALPGSDLAAIRASIDSWDGHIPTARTAAGSYTRKTLTAAIEADASENDRWLPGIPGQRRSPEQPAPKVPGQRSSVYDDVVLGDRYNDNFANGCF